MNKEEQLIMYRGQLKFLREKYMMILNLIEKYISRIETETTTNKNSQKNKDLIIELVTFLKDLGE